MRAPAIGIGIGVGLASRAGGGGVPTPDQILGAAILQRVRADQGISESSGRISAWNDISGNGLHYTQATGGARPLYDATGGPNGTPIVRFDSSSRSLDSALDLPAPGTTPTTIWAIIRQVTWVSIARILDSTTPISNHLLWQRLSADRISMGTTATNQNNAALVGTWARFENYWSGSAADYIKLIATPATGGTGATDASVGRRIGSPGGGGAVFDIAELLYINRALTADEKTQLDAYCTARYGAGLV
jgi:hypothetical protein